MLNYRLNTHGGFTPAAMAPPNAIDPELVLRHHRSQRRGGMGGQALSPPSSYQCYVFHIIVREILRSHFSRIFYPHSQFFRIHRKRFNPKDSLIPKMRLLCQIYDNRRKRISNQKYWYFSGTPGCQQHFYQESRFREYTSTM